MSRVPRAVQQALAGSPGETQPCVHLHPRRPDCPLPPILRASFSLPWSLSYASPRCPCGLTLPGSLAADGILITRLTHYGYLFFFLFTSIPSDCRCMYVRFFAVKVSNGL